MEKSPCRTYKMGGGGVPVPGFASRGRQRGTVTGGAGRGLARLGARQAVGEWWTGPAESGGSGQGLGLPHKVLIPYPYPLPAPFPFKMTL